MLCWHTSFIRSFAFSLPFLFKLPNRGLAFEYVSFFLMLCYVASISYLAVSFQMPMQSLSQLCLWLPWHCIHSPHDWFTDLVGWVWSQDVIVVLLFPPSTCIVLFTMPLIVYRAGNYHRSVSYSQPDHSSAGTSTGHQ